MSKLKPFLKWPGNKFQIINEIKGRLPQGNRLIEPFVGSGAVFLNTDYPEYYLSDINGDLINLYITLQGEGPSFIDYCKTFFISSNNNEERYYHWRQEFNSTTDTVLKSALFLYLNKHGYNGLCRYNSQGGYNVPFGRYVKPYFPEKELMYFYQKSQTASFYKCDFLEAMNNAKAGDVVYCDPPYVPLSSTSNFTSYASGVFGVKEQLKLAEKAKELAKNGVSVLMSNHNTAFILEAYSSAHISTLEVQRYISCDGKNRGKVEEVLALFTGGL